MRPTGRARAAWREGEEEGDGEGKGEEEADM